MKTIVPIVTAVVLALALMPASAALVHCKCPLLTQSGHRRVSRYYAPVC